MTQPDRYNAQPNPYGNGAAMPRNTPVPAVQNGQGAGQAPVQGGAQVPGYGYMPQGYPSMPGRAVAGGGRGSYYAPYTQQYVPPATSQPQTVKPKRRKRFWIALIVALICVALAIFLVMQIAGGGTSKRQGSIGQLEGKTADEIQAELDRVVDEGMFNISIASLVQFPSGNSEGDLRIENVPGNQYLMSVVITRDDTGQQIYQTDYIEPNHHIQTDTLDVDLPAGDYECTATFFAYDAETEEPVGQAAAKMTIEVLS